MKKNLSHDPIENLELKTTFQTIFWPTSLASNGYLEVIIAWSSGSLLSIHKQMARAIAKLSQPLFSFCK